MMLFILVKKRQSGKAFIMKLKNPFGKRALCDKIISYMKGKDFYNE